MSLMKSAEEMHDALMIRGRLLESARRELRDGFLAEALRDTLDALDHIQDNERRLLQLHAECHGLVEYCGKVLAQEAMRRPVSVVVERASPEPCEDPAKEIK